jgi:hypothetical protein
MSVRFDDKDLEEVRFDDEYLWQVRFDDEWSGERHLLRWLPQKEQTRITPST